MTVNPRAAYAPLLASAAVVDVAAAFLEAPAVWMLLGACLLLPLLVLVARWSPVRSGSIAAALGVAAVALWPVPHVWGSGSWLEACGAAAFWALPALGALLAGGYPRRQAARTRQAVRNARRDQQLELARDLHDFVGHDVSAIVVQAQAARFVAAQDPGQAVRALERIEAAGLSALESMDRTVHALREASGGPTAPVPGLAQLPELVERFDGASLDADPAAVRELSREADTTAYRVAVEALTNVRRHAPGAAVVRVAVRRAGAAVELSVANSAAARGAGGLLARRRRSGTGLAGLRGRVEAAGGTLRPGRIRTAGGGFARSSPRSHTLSGDHGGVTTRILIADDQEDIRSGFRLILDSQPDMTVVGEAADGESAVALARELRPDVVLADIRMPRLDGLEVTRLLAPRTRVVVVTTFDLDEYVHTALRNGACGFLLKRSGPALLIEGVRAAMAGDTLISPQITVRLLSRIAESGPAAAPTPEPHPLTGRELDIVRLVARGLTNAEIGAELFISAGTAKTHIANVQAKLGARNRVGIAAWAWEHGVVKTEAD